MSKQNQERNLGHELRVEERGDNDDIECEHHVQATSVSKRRKYNKRTQHTQFMHLSA